ncbi:MAG: sigma-E factor negative regulatory protein [Burkholderiales bacterium]|jgi:sigma-E factor negative regulatory protein RseA|nr:sigma-E factor negative regulatory protein [Burkholderiales bacterium]
MVTNRVPGETATQEKISQWMDGETDEEVERTIDATLSSEAGRDTWTLYHHIGDVLRDGAQSEARGEALSAAFTARVMQALEAEPIMPAPQAAVPSRAAPLETKPYYRAWALAAMVAGAAAVGWVAFALQGGIGGQTEETVASAASAEPAAMSAIPPAAEPVREVPGNPVSEALIPVDYLMTHQEFLPPVSMWPGVDAYQRIGGAWGHGQPDGQTMP